MISNIEYENKISLPNQLKQLHYKCKRPGCGFDIAYYKENLPNKNGCKILECPQCKHKEIFL
jgi:hypothetical protein